VALARCLSGRPPWRSNRSAWRRCCAVLEGSQHHPAGPATPPRQQRHRSTKIVLSMSSPRQWTNHSFEDGRQKSNFRILPGWRMLEEHAE
jgi:hypothetical protein